MARAYLSGQHTMVAIAGHFGVHYATVGRMVRDFEALDRGDEKRKEIDEEPPVHLKSR